MFFRARRLICILVILLISLSLNFSGITFAASIQNVSSSQAAQFNNVSYKFNDTVKEIPRNVQYRLRDITKEELFGNTINNIKLNSLGEGGQFIIPNTGINYNPLNAQTEGTQPLYPVESKYMILGQNTSFRPQNGEIYIDKVNNTAYKIVGNTIDDKDGNVLIPVIKPQLTEVFEYYRIPKQELTLNRNNITYIASDVELVEPEDTQSNQNSLPPPGMQMAPSISYESNNNVHTVRISNKLLYKYSSDSDKVEDKVEEKVEEEPADLIEGGNKDENNRPECNLIGVEDENDLKIEVTLTEGTISIIDPKVSVDIDLRLVKQKVDVKMVADAEADVTVNGNLNFKKVIEKCIYGYSIDIPYGRAFVGIFVVVDINGKVEVEVRTVTSGKFESGFVAEAIAGVPLYVGPYGTYSPDEFDVSVNVDGEVMIKASPVAQVGLIIFDDWEIAVLQLWVGGFKTYATLHAQAGTNTSARAEGRIKIDAFAELVGYIFDSRYSILYKDFNLVDREWKIGEEAWGASGTGQPLYKPIVIFNADAMLNTVLGCVSLVRDNQNNVAIGNTAREDIKKPPSGTLVHIWIEGEPYSHEAYTDSNGSFSMNINTVVPNKKVWVTLDGEYNYQSNAILPGIPYELIKFDADAFNNIVKGEVIGFKKDNRLYKYNGPLVITVRNKQQSNRASQIQTTAYEGIFSQEVDLIGGDEVTVQIPWEGVSFPKNIAFKESDLDSIKMYFNQYYRTGAIQNIGGSNPYTGDVKIISDSHAEEVVQAIPETITIPRFNTSNSMPFFIETEEIIKPSSTFKFSEDFVYKLGYIVSIEHDGIRKSIVYNPLGDLNNIINRPNQSQNPIESNINNTINSIINPSTNIMIIEEIISNSINSIDSSQNNNVIPISNIPIPSKNWSGVWFTEYGRMELTQNGDSVTGRSGYYEGIQTEKGVIWNFVKQYDFTGKVENNKLIGQYSPHDFKGSFEFEMSADGLEFKGIQYDGYEKIPKTDWCSWDGKRENYDHTSYLDTTTDTADWNGTWNTDFDIMKLTQSGNMVTGTYGEKQQFKIQGVINGNKLEGIFNDGSIYQFVVYMLQNKGSKNFVGWYGDPNSPIQDWNKWYGEQKN